MPTPSQGQREAGLREVLARRDIWRGRQVGGPPRRPSGDPALDRLIGGGWPRGGLSELLLPSPGQGEVELLLPLIRQLADTQRQVAIVSPPGMPCATGWQARGVNLEALLFLEPASERQRVWAIEQLAASAQVALTLAWLEKADFPLLRRLQLAAENGGQLLLLCRPARTAGQHSPAWLRLHVERDASGRPTPRLLKQRGATGSASNDGRIRPTG